MSLRRPKRLKKRRERDATKKQLEKFEKDVDSKKLEIIWLAYANELQSLEIGMSREALRLSERRKAGYIQ